MQESQYARSLIEASRDPLVTISIEGKIMDMNQAMMNMTGLSREELTGSDFMEYFTDSFKARDVYKEVFASGFVKDYPLTMKDHHLTDVLFNGSVYMDGKGQTLGAVVVARDITEQRRIESELTEARDFAELATGIAEVAQGKAEEATRIAEDAVKAKQQFLSNMSHEIRTPMNAIIGFTKVVLKTELTAKQKEYLTAIKMSGDSLIVLINDILDLAKVDAGKMTFEETPFKMAESISSMLHLFEPKIQEKNLVLEKNYDNKIPEVLVGDPVRLHQIILNLISNAVKFTSNGTIVVSVKLASEDEENVVLKFSVSDTGIGIEESKIARIFENFQQASSGTSRLYGGTGLGLAIVKQLVESQGGSLQVESEMGIGSNFSFVLSFKKTTEEAASNYVIDVLSTEKKNIKVLVVEDIALNQLLMKTLLDDFGFERDIAENGSIAIEKLQTNIYDVVLMDLQMPVMNGFEATDYIRNVLKLEIPIIALTADVTTVDLQKCKSVGMNDYIAKPVDEKLLYSKIINLISKRLITDLAGDLADSSVKLKNTIEKKRSINLDYLKSLTKSSPKLMMEMISIYLEQTPSLLTTMKSSVKSKNWALLQTTVHKMIPSFSIVGLGGDSEDLARKIHELAGSLMQEEGIEKMVLEMETICSQACIELAEELKEMKNKNKE